MNDINAEWRAFLTDHGAFFSPDRRIKFSSSDAEIGKKIFPLTHFAILTVSGTDAAIFLQGQLTCNIDELQENKASLAALCNPKGRVISVLLIIKNADRYLIILPWDLADKIFNWLSRYILRSRVSLINESEQFCVSGVCCHSFKFNGLKLPQEPYAVSTEEMLTIRLPGNLPRFWIIADSMNTINFWKLAYNQNNIQPGDSEEWMFLDLSSGLPWVSGVQSEKFIPQMLNLEQLGAISFNKGCYTGQEIVARTHYLGHSKRELVLAKCNETAKIDDNTAIIDSTDKEPIGKVLSFQRFNHQCRLLIVLSVKDRALENSLILDNPTQDKIHIIPFQ